MNEKEIDMRVPEWELSYQTQFLEYFCVTLLNPAGEREFNRLPLKYTIIVPCTIEKCITPGDRVLGGMVPEDLQGKGSLGLNIFMKKRTKSPVFSTPLTGGPGRFSGPAGAYSDEMEISFFFKSV
ncbi:hypothetical protein [Desulfoluna sp.]|uniref:hypothetical protein n=1 Tax=Desulfoluna sp. TaxID=2045199 RepID=UPI00260FAD42|nr:hypothetical protein [Desulfoluna sp.]